MVPVMAAPTQLDRIEAKLAKVELEQQQHTGLLVSLNAGAQLAMSQVTDLAAQLDAATTAEAAALAAVSTKIDAENVKIDAVQVELQSLFDRLVAAGTPQATLDSLTASIAKLGGSSTTLTAAGDALDAQAVRLTAMAVDPTNPVPTPPPAV
jgi:hypothetical protein